MFGVSAVSAPVGARASLSPGVTCVLTSCGRPDLLARTIGSFFAFNTAEIARFIVVEDGPAPLDAAARFTFPCPALLLSTGTRAGQTAAIDYAYSRVTTEYVFHLEDDWEFHAPGFIEKSLTLLKRLPDCLQVYIRALNDTNGHPVGRMPRRTGGVAWRRMRYGYKAFGGEWNGFSWNPGLRRTADYIAIGGYGIHAVNAPRRHAGAEIVLSRLYRERGQYAAILADRDGAGYCRHIGWDRTVTEARA